jgi:hypothetical protein
VRFPIPSIVLTRFAGIRLSRPSLRGVVVNPRAPARNPELLGVHSPEADVFDRALLCSLPGWARS